MIVLEEESSCLLITQGDHARLARRLLELWRRDGVAEHPRRDSLLLAVAEHDNGWQEADAAPHIDPASGLPYDFRRLPDPERLAVWHRGVVRHLRDQPYAALLHARHALHLHRRRAGDPTWDQALTQWWEVAAELQDKIDLGDDAVTADHRLLDLADTISLACCGVLFSNRAPLGYRLEDTPDGIGLLPFPLAGATSFGLPCRRIAKRVYGSATDLVAELAASPWSKKTVRIKPAAAAP